MDKAKEAIESELFHLEELLKDPELSRMSASEAQYISKVCADRDESARQINVIHKTQLPMPILANEFKTLVDFTRTKPTLAKEVLMESEFKAYLAGEHPKTSNSVEYKNKYRVTKLYPHIRILQRSSELSQLNVCRQLLEFDHEMLNDLSRLITAEVREKHEDYYKKYGRISSFNNFKISETTILNFISDLYYKKSNELQDVPVYFTNIVFSTLRKHFEAGATPESLKQVAYSIMARISSYQKFVEQDKPSPQVAHVLYGNFQDYRIKSSYERSHDFLEMFADYFVPLIMRVVKNCEQKGKFSIKEIFSNFIKDPAFKLNGVELHVLISRHKESCGLALGYLKSILSIDFVPRFSMRFKNDKIVGNLNAFPINYLSDYHEDGDEGYYWTGSKWKVEFEFKYLDVNKKPTSKTAIMVTMVVETRKVEGKIAFVERMEIYAGLELYLSPLFDQLAKILKVGNKFLMDSNELWYDMLFCPSGEDNFNYSEGSKRTLNEEGVVVLSKKQYKNINVYSMNSPKPDLKPHLYLTSGTHLMNENAENVFNILQLKPVHQTFSLSIDDQTCHTMALLKVNLMRALIVRKLDVGLFCKVDEHSATSLLIVTLSIMKNTEILKNYSTMLLQDLFSYENLNHPVEDVVNAALFKLTKDLNLKLVNEYDSNDFGCVKLEKKVYQSGVVYETGFMRIYPPKRKYHELLIEPSEYRSVSDTSEADLFLDDSIFKINEKFFSTSFSPELNFLIKTAKSHFQINMALSRKRRYAEDDAAGPSKRTRSDEEMFFE